MLTIPYPFCVVIFNDSIVKGVHTKQKVLDYFLNCKYEATYDN